MESDAHGVAGDGFADAPTAEHAASKSHGAGSFAAGGNSAPEVTVARPVFDEASRPHARQREPAARDDPRDGTANGRASARMLVDVHNHLRSELAQLREVIDEVAAGRTSASLARSLINEMSMRQNYWSLGAFCATYCRVLTMHHALEDAHLFMSLRLRDAELAPVIDRLSEEHEVVADILVSVDHALVAMVVDADRLDDVRAAVDRLSDVLLSHLAYEEQELLEPIARLGIDI